MPLARALHRNLTNRVFIKQLNHAGFVGTGLALDSNSYRGVSLRTSSRKVLPQTRLQKSSPSESFRSSDRASAARGLKMKSSRRFCKRRQACREDENEKETYHR